MNRLFASAAPHPRTVHTGNSKLGGQVTFQGVQLFLLFSVALESLFVREEPLILVLGKQKLMDLSEFKASLIYVTSYRPTRVI